MSLKNKKEKKDPVKRDFTRLKTPHTYAIIFFAVVVCWILTFLIPAGKFSTHTIEYTDANGETATRTVLMADTFRYSYPLDTDFTAEALAEIRGDESLMEELEVDPEALDALLKTDSSAWTQEDLDAVGLSDDEMYARYGEAFYDTSRKLHKTAGIWGTEDFGGFGFLNYVFEGLVTGDRSGSAVGICALILVVGGAFGIIMKTGAIDAGIYAFIRTAKGLERLALPLFFLLFSLGGATFGMAEECIPFAMIMVPFVIALGYDSIVAVTVTYVASQVGNAVSWMSPFSVAVAQGIAGVPVLSGATFRLIMWFVVTVASAGFMMVYAERIRRNPQSSVVYEGDAYFRDRLDSVPEEKREFSLGHKLILLEMLAVLIWIIWGVTQKGFYIPEIASQFFVMGFAAGVTAILFRLNGMTINGMASAFQSGGFRSCRHGGCRRYGERNSSGSGRFRCRCSLHTEHCSVRDRYRSGRRARVYRRMGHVHLPEPVQPGGYLQFRTGRSDHADYGAALRSGGRAPSDRRPCVPAGRRLRGRLYSGIRQPDRRSRRCKN